MKMKPIEPNAIIRDPQTKQPLPTNGGDVPDNTFWTRRWLAGETWRLEGAEWVRQLPSGELARALYVEPAPEAADIETTPFVPVAAPIAPLTTREGE